MNLAKYERETIIRYNEEESEAVIDTCHRKLINKLDRLGAKVIHQDNYGKRYVIPDHGWCQHHSRFTTANDYWCAAKLAGYV